MSDQEPKPADHRNVRSRTDGAQAREHRLERRLDHVTESAAVFVHDLRTPVSVAAGRIALAREEHGDGEHLEAAAEALERVGTILTEWDQLRSNDGHQQWEVVELESVLRSTWNELETESAELTVDDSAPVRADADAFDRLVTNLVTNAVNHAGPSVTIRVGTIEDDGFYVEDDGPGIPPEEREDVFAPGYSSDGCGHGFGLTSVELVADAHGWDVSIQEGNDGGARFEFRGVEVL